MLATLSIGVAVWGCAGDGGRDLPRRVDLVLHRAKEDGTSSYRRLKPGLDDSLKEQLTLEGELPTALEREELRVVYQPKLAGSGEIFAWRSWSGESTRSTAYHRTPLSLFLQRKHITMQNRTDGAPDGELREYPIPRASPIRKPAESGLREGDLFVRVRGTFCAGDFYGR